MNLGKVPPYNPKRPGSFAGNSGEDTPLLHLVTVAECSPSYSSPTRLLAMVRSNIDGQLIVSKVNGAILGGLGQGGETFFLQKVKNRVEILLK